MIQYALVYVAFLLLPLTVTQQQQQQQQREMKHLSANTTTTFPANMDSRTEQRLRERWSAILNERTRPVEIDTFVSSPSQVHAVAGKDLYLTCGLSRVLTGRLRVSFLRLSDLALLSVGRRLHTPDPRVRVVHSETEAPRVWTIRIRDARVSDSGPYECQVNTSPQTTTRVFSVSVVESSVRIKPDEPVIYLNEGSKLSLTCVVSAGGLTPQFIMWYRDDRIISYSNNNNNNNVKSEGEVKTVMWTENEQGSSNGSYDSDISWDESPRHLSRLIIDSVTQDDSGEYRCDSDLTGEAKVNVYVVHADLKSLASEDQQHEVEKNDKTQSNAAVRLTFDIISVALMALWFLKGLQ